MGRREETVGRREESGNMRVWTVVEIDGGFSFRVIVGPDTTKSYPRDQGWFLRNREKGVEIIDVYSRMQKIHH